MGSMPSTGQIKTTAVPLHTARPNCLVSSVSLNGSSGSLKHSVVLSNTTFSKASKPFKTPVAEDRSKYTIKLWVTFSNAMRRSNSDHFLNIWTKLLMNTESANKKPLLLNKRRFITIHTIEATGYSI